MRASVLLLLLLVVSCVKGDGWKRFVLVVEDSWGAPDGQARSLTLFNGTLPGPELHVEEGDSVEITVHNKMMERTTSLHIHGLFFAGQPWQDGVAMITQCPILPNSHYTYRFVVQNDAGTYWYHSHVAAQVGDGAFGMFIIHKKKSSSEDDNKNNRVLADIPVLLSAWWWRDQHSLFSEWSWQSDSLHEGMHDHMFFMEMKNVLVNGRGPQHKQGPSVIQVPPLPPGDNNNFSVKLRFLNSCSPVPFIVRIEGHLMMVVAMDGKEVKPFQIETLLIEAGQRFDVLVPLNQSLALGSSHWLLATAYHHHGAMPGMQGHTGRAIFRYSGDSTNAPSDLPDPHIMKHALLQPLLRPNVVRSVPRATRRMVMNLSRKLVPNVGYRWHINNETMRMPKSPLLLDAYYRRPYDGEGIVFLNRGEVVDFVFNNVGHTSGPHPWHPHGHAVWLLGTGVDKGAFNDTEKLNEVDPPLCDVFIVPHNGWVAVRMKIDHAGAWMFHCHVSPHHMGGMGFIMLVDPTMVPPPPARFPTHCGSYPNDLRS